MTNETAALNANPAPPLSSFLPFPGTSGKGTHGITWIGGYYYQHTIEVVPSWFELVAGFSYVNIINDNVADISQVPWVAAEEHYQQYLHRWGGVFHLGKEISIYALNANNISPPSTAEYFQNGQVIPPQSGTDNELGLKTALLNGKISSDFTWFHMATTNIAQTSGQFLANGHTIKYIDELTLWRKEWMVMPPSPSFPAGSWWSAFYAGHDRDQNNKPIAGTCQDNSLWPFHPV